MWASPWWCHPLVTPGSVVERPAHNPGLANASSRLIPGALSVSDRENYAVLMRVAMLSSLEARDATANMGFRCARSSP